MIVAGVQKSKPYIKGSLSTAQVSFLDQTKEIPQIAPYGFFSMPPIESVWTVFSLLDTDDILVGVGNDYRNGPTGLKAGEIAVYNTLTKASHIFKANGDVEVFTDKELIINATNKVTINTKVADINVSVSATIDCPETTWTGNITLEGDFLQTGAMTVDGSVGIIGDVDVDGDVEIDGTSTADDHISSVALFNTHTHIALGGPPSPI